MMAIADLRALLTRAGEALHRWSRFEPEGRCFCDRCEQSREFRALHAEITAALANAPDDEWCPQWRHRKHGTEYVMIGTGEVQTEEPLTEAELVAIYQGHDGKLWVRRRSEFHDGRFEALYNTEVSASGRYQPAPDDGITIKLLRREDGGLRVCSDDVRGLILSGPDPAKVISDIWPALEVLQALAPPPAERKE